MSNLKIEARVVEIQEVKTGTSNSGKDWSNQVFVLETEDRYPKLAAFQASGKLLEDVKLLRVGQIATVHFDIVSRKHNESWYTQANAWKIEGIAPGIAPVQEQAITVTAEAGSDLPF
jgi:hypothetical protein